MRKLLHEKNKSKTENNIFSYMSFGFSFFRSALIIRQL